LKFQSLSDHLAIIFTKVDVKIKIDFIHAATAAISLLTAWQFLTDLGHDEPNPLQPNRHEPYFWKESPCARDGTSI